MTEEPTRGGSTMKRIWKKLGTVYAPYPVPVLPPLPGIEREIDRQSGAEEKR
jgi:hypothetical protein